MKTKLLISAMLVMGLSLGVNNTVSAQRHGGHFGIIRPRIFVPPIPRVVLAVRSPVYNCGYGDYPVYRRPRPRYYQGNYYGDAYYRDNYRDRDRRYDRDGYRENERREQYRGEGRRENYRENGRGYDNGRRGNERR